MATFIKTADSTANTAQTLTLTAPKVNNTTGNTRYLLLHSLTVSTSGADLAADMGVKITTGSGQTWNVELRSGKVFGGHFEFSHPIVSRGDITIVADAGGALVVSTLSVVYEVR